ncbi:MAG: hypothetical protein AAB615_02130 [Patescibacteria group bacterium]
MFEHFAQFFFFLDLIAFIAVIGMHLVKSNTNIIRLYFLQSLSVGVLLFSVGLVEGEHSLLWIGVLTLVIKSIVAPIFFARLLRRFSAQQSANNYLSVPLTLFVLLLLVLFSYSNTFLPLGVLAPEALGSISLGLASVFMAIFLLINRRGAFSQMIGILALENAIVLLASFVGLEQPIALEVGIIFDIVIWIVIATAFISMMYRQFKSLDVSHLTHLRED